MHTSDTTPRSPLHFRAPEHDEAEVHVTGQLPEWLRGTLMRTAPAVFETPKGWRAEHWFDGLGMLYAFELGERPLFKQRLMESTAREDAERGMCAVGTFGTDTRRGLLSRLFSPAPKITDNTNVNVVPWQDGDWLAMTESQHQYRVDAETLRQKGLERYDDALPASLGMVAHPSLDRARGALVNVGVQFRPRSQIVIYRQDLRGGPRVEEGRISFGKVPYVHSFGLSARHVVLLDHPLRVSALRMLFSNRAFIKHFHWEPERGAGLIVFDRHAQTFTRYECEPFFCFHVIHQFEDGDDLVLDFLAFPDASIVSGLTMDALERGIPAVSARPTRARLRPGSKRAELTPLSDELRFEFPAVDPARANTGRYESIWGASLGPAHSSVVRLDLNTGDALHFEESGFTYGEPVFVRDPSGASEGVILTVGAHEHEERSVLRVLDATRLEPLAALEVDVVLPLGFHGSFRRSP